MRCRVIALLLILLSTDRAFGQATPVPVPVYFPQLAMGGDPNGQNYVTIIQIVNNIDFGSSVGFDFGSFTLDGTAMLNAMTPTLSGTFKPPNITGTVPSGTPAVFYIVVLDSSGNVSNFIGIPVRF